MKKNSTITNESVFDYDTNFYDINETEKIKEIINKGDLEEIKKFAFINEKYNYLLLKNLTDAGNAYAIYYLIRNRIKGVTLREFEEAIITVGDPIIMQLFAIKTRGADINRLLVEVIRKRNIAVILGWFLTSKGSTKRILFEALINIDNIDDLCICIDCRIKPIPSCIVDIILNSSKTTTENIDFLLNLNCNCIKLKDKIRLLEKRKKFLDEAYLKIRKTNKLEIKKEEK